MSYSKILVANRGEIACRVFRTARRMGYSTVAVYSEADRGAWHTRHADEAVCIGGPAAADSYLRIDALLDAARRTGADALHPGYGFLSENPAFAQACADDGRVFVGPPPAAMAAMGDKARAKQRMLAAGIPCLPGYLGEAQDDAALCREAMVLGFPLLVKAVAGGGGRGMRVVRGPAELEPALAGARREAVSAFGDGRLMLEVLIENARHIEIQVFADAHGQVLHLGERDCTTQRRRQKVIEEAPSPAVGPALRAAMGRDAVAAARAVGYQGAGTVEFIVGPDGRHCFLEMNTRLQVEHPVTEAVTGLDLVEWQLRVAAGEPLPMTQDEVQLTGHAIEARLYAEDPSSGFAPQTGTVLLWRPEAAQAAGVRIDSGIAKGSVVTPWYDPMLAKLVAHGRDREEAIRRLRAALSRVPLLGLAHNASFLHDLLDHASFRTATLDTSTLDRWQASGAGLPGTRKADDRLWALAAAFFCWRGMVPGAADLRANSVESFDLPLRCGNRVGSPRVQLRKGSQVQVTFGESTCAVTLEPSPADAGARRVTVDGVTREVALHWEGTALHLWHDAAAWVFTEVSSSAEAAEEGDPSRACSPVAGRVSQVAVANGEPVAPGQALVCVEAMKMEMWVRSACTGTVRQLHVSPGQSVSFGQLLVALVPSQPDPH